MLRTLFAVIVGLIACQAVFSILAFTAMLIWPDYARHAHHWLDRRTFTFTSIMAFVNLVFWVLAFIGAGWTTAKTTRDGKAVLALAGLMTVYSVYVHLLRDWMLFPWWYNCIVVISVIPAALLGARFVEEA